MVLSPASFKLVGLFYWLISRKKEGLSNGYSKVINEGAKETLKLVENIVTMVDLNPSYIG